MESDGQTVYRLFGDIIDDYKLKFEAAETEWQNHIKRCAYFDHDFKFVSRFERPDRLDYWTDKIHFFETNNFEPPPILNFHEHMYWLNRPTEYEMLESELLACLHKYMLSPGTNEVRRAYILRQMNPLGWCQWGFAPDI